MLLLSANTITGVCQKEQSKMVFNLLSYRTKD